MKFFFSLFFGTFFFFACSQSNPNFHRYEIHPPEEFVAQSCAINAGGKFAIASMEGKCIADLPPDALDIYKDKIEENDLLNVVIYHPSRKDLMDSIQLLNARIGGFPVINGMISLPCISPVFVRDLTLSEASHVLTDKFREEIQDVEVFITYKGRLSNKVELAGMASVPYIPVDGRIRLFEVLALAHLPPDANLFASYVMRDNFPLKVDLQRLVKEGDMSQNIVMKGGDKVYIANPTDSFAIVMGEVAVPRPVPLPSGFISLREALVIAHGIPFTGNKNCIYIIRGGVQCPEIFRISWSFMLHQPNENLLLIPGDVVYVTEKPITQWNIFLQQLQPTLNAVLTVYQIRALSQGHCRGGVFY